MDKDKPQIGDARQFRNRYAYPSLDGQWGTVQDVWTVADQVFVALLFDSGFRMAVRPPEIGWYGA